MKRITMIAAVVAVILIALLALLHRPKTTAPQHRKWVVDFRDGIIEGNSITWTGINVQAGDTIEVIGLRIR